MKLLLIFFVLVSRSSAVTFNCTFGMSSSTIVGERYRCLTVPLNYTEEQRLTEVRGTHILGRNNSNVERLDLTSCTELTFIPQEINVFFPNLSVFMMNSCKLSVLQGNELNVHPHLELFTVNSNQITRIPGNFFALTPRLRYIDFGNNNLSHAGENLLENLAFLSHAYFHNNLCINFYVTNSSIGCLIGNLRRYCPDIIEPETTTITTDGTMPTTTPIIGPNFCDLHDTVCYLKDQNSLLLEQSSRILEQNVLLLEQNVGLIEQNTLLMEQTAELRTEVSAMKTQVGNIEEMLTELINLMPNPTP